MWHSFMCLGPKYLYHCLDTFKVNKWSSSPHPQSSTSKKQLIRYSATGRILNGRLWRIIHNSMRPPKLVALYWPICIAWCELIATKEVRTGSKLFDWWCFWSNLWSNKLHFDHAIADSGMNDAEAFFNRTTRWSLADGHWW